MKQLKDFSSDELKAELARRQPKKTGKFGKPTCNHTMQPMYHSHSDGFAGMRCSKCGYTEWS